MWAFLMIVLLTGNVWEITEVTSGSFSDQESCNSGADLFVHEEMQRENVESVSRSICYPYEIGE